MSDPTPRPTPILAISLDLDDTLWPMRPVLLAAEHALQRWLGERAPVTAALLASPWRIEHRRRLIDAHPERVHDVGWMRLRMIGDALAASREPPALAEPAYRTFLAARQRVTLYPDVRPVLEAWSRDYTLIAISNGNADLHEIGLAKHFGVVIGAHQAGFAKPDPRIFRLACERAGVPPAQVLHVGDDWMRDVEGARLAGLQAAWLRREDLGEAEGPADEPRFESLRTLAGHLAGRPARGPAAGNVSTSPPG